MPSELGPIGPTIPWNPGQEEYLRIRRTPEEGNIDAAEVYLDIQISGEEIPDLFGTVYIDLQVLGGECFSSFSGDFLGEGEAYLEWSGVDTLEWSSTDNLEWSSGTISSEAHC